MSEVRDDLVQRVREWIAADPDPDDRATLEGLLTDGDEAELDRRFAHPLTFGTAGLRGPEMAGPAGMNRLSVRRATQGVVAWLTSLDADLERGVVVGRDARHGSERFNDEVVRVLVGAGVVVWEMPRPLPTPFVSYAVRALGAVAGIMITASHNPPADNGYKLYGSDGSQIIPPHDAVVQDAARRAGPAALGERGDPRHHVIEPTLFDAYRDHFVARFAVPEGSDLAVVYTPLHGVGGQPATDLLAAAGFSRVTVVDAQFAPDPAFPTLAFPNPEEPGALDLAMARADEAGATLVVANDPDADRLGAAVRGPGGWRVLLGDEIGWLLGDRLLATATGPDDVVATSIVSSTMLAAMAARTGVRYVTTLTGFKWIAKAAGAGVLRFGYEEALGFAVDPLVADKDGLSAALALCRLAHDLAREGRTLLDRLDDLERDYGVHAIDHRSWRVEGDGALERLRAAYEQLRDAPPTHLGATPVDEVADLARGWRGLPPTTGLVLVLVDGRVVVRPSGTEPKLKAYVEVTASPSPALVAHRAAARARAAVMLDELSARLALSPPAPRSPA
ncbi:MAG: phospho-sugar mutase [Acidimicrobiales bacterium]